MNSIHTGRAQVVAEHGSLWAIDRENFDTIALAVAGGGTNPKAGDSFFAASARSLAAQPTQGIGIIPVMGVIVERASWISRMFGDTSVETISQKLDDMLANPSVGQIVFNISSPGGSVFGVPELADKIRAARDRKPIIAVANSQALSAAYWLGSQANKFYVTPSGQVGSVGVWNAHVDISEADKKAGVKTTLVAAGKYKTERHPFAPLTKEAQAEMQRSVDEYHDMFVKAVAAGRRRPIPTILESFGQGRSVMARDAAAVGMVDGIATLDSVLAHTTRSNGPKALAWLRLAESQLALHR
jgi:capsid assembly protease